jgi:hypothetical protein
MPAAVQVLFAQQGWLRPPHVAHVSVLWSQPSVDPVHMLFAQHG